MELIEVKTAELVGPALDWAVAGVVGESIVIHSPSQRRYDVRGGIHCSSDGCTIGPRSINGDTEEWSPSTNWSLGGPLLDKYATMVLSHDHSSEVMIGGFWNPSREAACEKKATSADGSTILIALCRAIVSAKLGDVVQVPAELVGVAS